MQSYNYHSAKPKIRSRWLPILIGALCFVTLLMLSWKLRDREQENLQNTISSEAEHLATDIKVDFRNRVQFLESMVKRWELQKGTSKDEYINDTGSLLSIALGFQAVEWVDKVFYVRWISPLKGNEKAQNLNLAFEENRRSTMEKARDTQSPAVSKPIDLVQGGKGFLVFFPIYFDGKFDGFILAVFEIHKWLDYVFGFDSKNSLSDKYNICIYFDDVPVYKNGDFVKQTYTMQATEVIKVLDKNISIYIEPSKAFIKVDIASLPNLTIFIGIFLSVIIAFVVFLFQRTYIEVKRTHLSNNILESKTALLKAQTNSNIDGILVIDHNNKRLLINKRFVELFNAPTEVQEDEDDTAMLRHVTSLTQYPDQFLDKIKYLNSHPNEISRDEIEFKSGMVIDRYSSPVQGEDGQYYGRIWVFHDITERKNTETYKEMRLEVLNILNEQKDLKFSILRVIHTLKTQTGFDAVGIRLQNGEDFPYFGHEGFSDDFLATENTLIRHDANGWVCKDKDGKVCLECTCGIVISGKTDPTDPLFTHGGSFWTNNSFSLLDLPSYQDPRFHPRNKCIYQGYASWALIPIRSQERIIGLIHISSRNKKALSIERIEILEVIASHIGSFLMRIKSEEELIELSSRFSLAARAGGVGIWDYDIVNNKLAWDDRMFELYGIKREQFSGAYEAWQSGLHPDDKIRGDAEIQMAIKGEKEFNTEFRVIWPDRTIRYIRAMSSVSRDVKGKPIHMIGTNWDITESMKMEQTLKTQLMNISAILENSPYLMWLKDSEGKFLSVNENFAHSCGRNNPNELIGLTDLDIWPEDLARKYRSDDSKVIALKSRSIVEEPIEDLGHRKWFETIKTPIIDDTGSVIGTVGMARDVTERREYQENLNKEKERLKNVILGTNAGTWEWNLQTGKTLFNDRWAEIAGYTLEELEPVNIKTWEKLIHPDDLIKSGMLLQKHFNKESDYYSCDCRIRHKNGSWIWVSDKGRLMQWDESGKPLLMSGTHIDISERKKIESDLKIQNDFYTILTRLSEKLIQTDSSAIDDAINSALKTLGTFNNVDRSYIFEVDESADEMSNTYEWCEEGITSERMNLQKLPFSLIPRWKDEYSHNRYVYIESVKDLPTECQSEKDVLEPQGIKSLVTVPMYYGSSLLGFIGFDSVRSIKSWNLQVINLLKIIASVIAGVITKKNTEALLQKAKDRADKDSKSKSEFLANMSHEIRTPLNGVIGFTELLSKTPLTPVQKQYVENAKISSRSLLGIINDILDLSKIEAGKLELEIIKTNLVELIEQASDIIKYHASQKNLELLLNIQPDIPRYAMVDPIRLKQILVNLLGNAVKFTEHGEVELKVTFSEQHDLFGSFCFSIRDTGIGITQENQKKIFDSFSQADTSTTRKFGGTGLGLTISSLLALKMGNGIKLESEPGKGSVFSFTIETQYEFGENYTHDSLKDISRVLVVDDNENNRMILKHTFMNWGVECTSCDNGFSALKIIESSKHFDVIIIDYHMPDLNGLDTVERIRTQLNLSPEKQHVILLHSSMDDSDIQKRCKNLGVLFNLSKPLKSTELFEYLRSICNKSTPYKMKNEIALDQTRFEILSKISPVILVAEDVAMNTLLITILIKKLLPNAKILEAKNGREALDVAKGTKLDLILMDVQMPEMDGVEATAEIRSFESLSGGHVPIIALTAGALKGDREKCLKIGMDDFLTKPIEEVVLQKMLQKFLALVNSAPPTAPDKRANTNGIMHFDKNKLMDKIDKDEALFEKLLELIATQMPDDIEMLRKAIHENNIEQSKKTAHKIIGSSLNMCFDRLATLSREIEESTENNIEKFESIFKNMLLEWEHIQLIEPFAKRRR